MYRRVYGASGLSYQVNAEGGFRLYPLPRPALVARRGAPLSRAPRGTVALSAENYQFIPEGINEQGLAIVRLQPLRKDRALIAGRMFLTVDGDLGRVEGRLAKNPSFWTTRVNVVRSVSADQRGAHARVAGNDGTTQAVRSVGAPHDVSLRAD